MMYNEFNAISFQPDQYKTNSRKGKNLYFQFDKVIKFDRIMRQQGQENALYRDILKRISSGSLTKEDWEKSLCPRQLSKLDNKQWFLNNATKLTTTNKARIEHNIRQIKLLGTPIAQVQAINRGPNAKNQPSSSAGGLSNTILLAKGAKVMCTSNIAKNLGIVNGKLICCFLTTLALIIISYI